MEKPHGKNLRIGRYSEPNRIYSITVVTHKRRPFFRDFKSARTVIKVLQKHEQLQFAQTLCFVLMPDHLHWLMQLGEKKDLGQTIQSFKSICTRKLGKTIFQKGFFDHAIRQEEDIRDLARYIVANPIRAGLVSKIHDYPHWDAVWMSEQSAVNV